VHLAGLASEIVAQRRYHHQYLPDVIFIEPGTFDAHTTAELKTMGYHFRQEDPWGSKEPWGFMNVVTWNHQTNQLDAASDPRHPSGLGKVQ
jgi:gamma-glutamyltranspeptidase/glutathione hydrolase